MKDHTYYTIYDWSKHEIWGYLRAYHDVGTPFEIGTFIAKSIGQHASLDSPVGTAEAETNILLARMPVLEFHEGDATTVNSGSFAGRRPVIVKKRRPRYRNAIG